MLPGRWSEWVLKEKEAIEHIKYAYEQGINAFECAGSLPVALLVANSLLI